MGCYSLLGDVRMSRARASTQTLLQLLRQADGATEACMTHDGSEPIRS